MTPGERTILQLLLEAMSEEVPKETLDRILGRFALLCDIGVDDCCIEDRKGWQN